MTVHKSQGSEFEAILLVLPAEKSRILSRELLYTAVTRGKRLVVLVADPRAVELALSRGRREERRTRLAERLAGRLSGEMGGPPAERMPGTA